MERNLVLSSLFFLLLTLIAAEVTAQSPPKAIGSAAMSLRLNGANIKLETFAYVNVMPRGLLSKEKRVPVDCSKSGRFIVGTTISVADESALPPEIEVSRVWVYIDGSWWNGVFNKEETTITEKTIRTVARDCPQKVLRGGEKVKVVVALSHKGKTYYLRSTQDKLYAAS